jgi:hypothetical protein
MAKIETIDTRSMIPPDEPLPVLCDCQRLAAWSRFDFIQGEAGGSYLKRAFKTEQKRSGIGTLTLGRAFNQMGSYSSTQTSRASRTIMSKRAR